MQLIYRYINRFVCLFLFLCLCFSTKAQDSTLTRGAKITVQKSADSIAGEVYAIIVGVSNYPDINPLKYADKDALLFRDFLLTPSGGNTKPENIKLLINDSATSGEFYGKARSWLKNKNLKKGDRLYLYFSGHGDAMGEEDYFFLPYDCDPRKDPGNYLLTSNIEIAKVKTLFIKPEVAKEVEVFLIMDACRTNELAGGAAGQQNFVKNFIAEKKYGEIMLLSTGAGQVSIESPTIGNGHGLFTYYLIDGLAGAADKDAAVGDNNGIVTLAELSSYVKSQVRIRAKKEFNSDQNPVYCCPEKDLAVISKFDNPTYTAWENAKKIQRMSGDQNLFAARSIRQGEKAVGDLVNNDSVEIIIYNRFVSALKKGKLLGDSSAETLYREMENKWPGKNLTEDAKYSLATKYLNFCQQKINLFLSGKGIVHILDMEKKAIKDNSGKSNNSFSGLDEDELHKLKTLVNTDYIVALKMMDIVFDLLKQETELLEPYQKKYDFLKTMAAYADKSNNLNYVLEQCNRYIISDPLSPSGYLLKGWIYQNMENDSSEFYFRKAGNIAPKWSYPQNGLGNYYLSQNKYDTALYYFDKAIDIDSLNSDAYRNRGLAHFILGGYAGKTGMSIIDITELDKARKDFVQARNLNPGDCYAKAYFADHQLVFLKSYQKGSPSYNAYYDNAKYGYLASISCDSNFAMGYQKLADFYEYLGDTLLGLSYLQDCVLKNPKNGDGFRNLGNYYLQTLQDTVLAIENFKKAIRIDPSTGSNYFSLARLYRKQKNRAKAINVYSSALDHIGNNKDLLNEIGNTFFEPPSQFETAIMYYKQALSIDSTLSYTLYNLGKIYNLKENGQDSSFYYYGKAVKYNPYRFRDMILPVADYYYYDKRLIEAKLYYTQALNFRSLTKYRTLERLINILIGESSFTEAENILNKYLDPQSENEIFTRLSKLVSDASEKK